VRAVSRALGGSCTVPLGAYAQVLRDRLRLQAVVAAPDGRRVARAEDEGTAGAPEQLGERVAALLRARGAGEILATLQASG
jgi:hydroxymethylbilane synthase